MAALRAWADDGGGDGDRGSGGTSLKFHGFARSSSRSSSSGGSGSGGGSVPSDDEAAAGNGVRITAAGFGSDSSNGGVGGGGGDRLALRNAVILFITFLLIEETCFAFGRRWVVDGEGVLPPSLMQQLLSLSPTLAGPLVQLSYRLSFPSERLRGALRRRGKVGRSGEAARFIPGQKMNPDPFVWPLPANFSNGRITLPVSPDLQIIPMGRGAVSEVLKEGVRRYLEVLQKEMAHAGPLSRPRWMREGGGSGGGRGRSVWAGEELVALEVVVKSEDDKLDMGVDESYSLQVPVEDTLVARIEAETVYGALRGLETFSQMCVFSYRSRRVVIRNVPWVVYDWPRFPHRGLLVDTSRHFQPVAIMEEIIDSMAYVKFNVLHWHMVDEQAFPIEVPSFPLLWEGSYTPSERYTMDDIDHIVRYAASRGVMVVPEIDIPGHAASWGKGYPELLPSPNCPMPLDVSNNFTFDVIRGILSDLATVVPYGWLHLGGDEVSVDCWVNTPHIFNWMEKHKMNTTETYAYFVVRVRAMAAQLGWKRVVLWEETFSSFGQKLNKSDAIQMWITKEVSLEVVKAGFDLLVSPVGEWYLDHPEHDWWSAYGFDPVGGMPFNATLRARVRGGEACMWTEHVDASNIFSRVWPKAASVAEKLWSPYRATRLRDHDRTQRRISRLRCLMHRRGVGANYVTLAGYYGELQPNSCYDE